MSGRFSRAVTAAGIRGSAGLATAGLVLLGSAGCSVVQKINDIRHAVDANRQVIQTFAQGLKNSKAIPFQVTYVTTGNSPTTVVYAVRPPKDISFKETSASGGGASDVNLIANSSGEFSCSEPTQGAQFECVKLGTASAAAQNALFAIYTPSHWVTFLEAFSIAAGVAGDKVTTSHMTVNGFPLNCVDFKTKHVTGTSTICTTSDGILGYVKVADQPTSFEIKGYTSTPPASAFELPPGAKVTSGNG
jgi:hypothetical protein